MEVLLEKFREKKPLIVQAVKDAADAVYSTVCDPVNSSAIALEGFVFVFI